MRTIARRRVRIMHLGDITVAVILLQLLRLGRATVLALREWRRRRRAEQALHQEIAERALTQTEVAELRQAVETLRESEQMYKTLIEITDTGSVIVDGEGHVIEANAQYLRLSG